MSAKKYRVGLTAEERIGLKTVRDLGRGLPGQTRRAGDRHLYTHTPASLYEAFEPT